MFSRWRSLSPLALVLVVASCATAPPARAPGTAAAWLGGQPRVVARIDTSQVAAWAEVTRSRDAFKAVGDRTRVVWLGFDLANLDDLKTAADTVSVALEGEFPKGAAGLVLDWNSSWKKNGDVWTNPALDLSVSLPEDNLVTVRRHSAVMPTPAWGVLRDLDPAAVARAGVWLTFWDPGLALFGEAGARLLPVSRLDVTLNAVGENLDGIVTLHATDERAARAAAVVLKLFAEPFRARFGQVLEWQTEGSLVVGRTLSIPQAALKTLAEQLLAPEETP